jgi:hypothetical protein
MESDISINLSYNHKKQQSTWYLFGLPTFLRSCVSATLASQRHPVSGNSLMHKAIIMTVDSRKHVSYHIFSIFRFL